MGVDVGSAQAEAQEKLLETEWWRVCSPSSWSDSAAVAPSGVPPAPAGPGILHTQRQLLICQVAPNWRTS